jgi:hypothetical protein
LEKNELTLRAFEQVKQLMSSPPVLTMFNAEAAHVVECDASDLAVGTCLKQTNKDGTESVVAYASKALSDAQRRWCTTRKELYAVLFALSRWRHYLVGRKVTVRTDHNCLQYLLKGKNLTNQLARYLDFIADYDLTIEYKPGRENQMADFLSRLRPCEIGERGSCKQCNGTANSNAPRFRRAAANCTKPKLSTLPSTSLSAEPVNTCRVTTRGDRRAAVSNQTAVSGATPADHNPRNSSDDSAVNHSGRRRKNGRGQTLLQTTAPAAAADISINQHWSREYIIAQQECDPVLAEVKRWLIAGQRPPWSDLKGDPILRCYYQQFESLSLVENVLYRKFIDVHGGVKYFQLLLPVSMRAAFLELIHATALGHAKMLQKNESQAQLHAYWPTWKRDIKIFVAACRRCAEYHRGDPPKQGHLRPTGGTLGAPGELLSIDLTGPHPASAGYKYILTAEDCFTKYLSLIPLRDKTAEHVARALFQIYLRQGYYSAVKSDNGLEFINGVQSKLDKLTHSVRLKTTSYTPRNNPVERSHRSIDTMIGKLVDKRAQ